MLSDKHQEEFESIVLQMNQWTTTIPIQFLLGFYVNTAISRWWNRCVNETLVIWRSACKTSPTPIACWPSSAPISMFVL